MKRIVQAVKYISILLVASASAATREAETMDWIVAIVNDEPILHSELVEEIDRFTLRLQQAGAEIPTYRRIYPVMLNQTIDYRLKQQRAKQLNISVPSEEIEQSIAEAIAAEGLTSLNALLERLRISEAKLRELITIEARINEARLRDSSGELSHYATRLDSALRRTFNDRIVMEFEVEQIQLASGEFAEAERLREQVYAGEDFARLAAEYSIAESAAQGGNLGWHTANTLPEAVAAEIAELTPNEITLPIELANGVHLFRLKASRPLLIPGVEKLAQVCIFRVEVADHTRQLADELMASIVAGETTLKQAGEQPGAEVEQVCLAPEELPASLGNPERLRIGELLGPVEIQPDSNRWEISIVTSVSREVVGGEQLRESASEQYERVEIARLDERWSHLLRSYADIQILRAQP